MSATRYRSCPNRLHQQLSGAAVLRGHGDAGAGLDDQGHVLDDERLVDRREDPLGHGVVIREGCTPPHPHLAPAACSRLQGLGTPTSRCTWPRPSTRTSSSTPPSSTRTSRAGSPLLSQLRTAADDGQLVLHYQPLLHLATGQVRGVEALVRWQHPQDGLLPPAQFVPLAESSGLVHLMTRSVLAMACTPANAWRHAGTPLVVAVNISARSLMDATLPDTVAEHLAGAGLPAHLLKLEITESAVIANPARARSVLDRLQPSASPCPSTTSGPATPRSRTCASYPSKS